MTPYDRLAGLDKLIHEPARLAITTALRSCQRADFLFLLRLTGLSKGNLSSHLARLEAGGIVEITKAYSGKTPITWVALTERGDHAVTEYWDTLDEIRRDVADSAG